MNATALRKRVTRSLLNDIEDVQYPSVTMMNRVEAVLEQDDLANYAEVLVKKIEASQYPSISLLNRLDGLLGQLERAERSQREQRSDGGSSD
jgi:hypothetical protein